MICCFQGEFEFLSNFYTHNIEYNGIVYPTVEHAFQAAKCLDNEEKLKILEAPTPGKAKRIGKKIVMRPDWDNIKIDVMKDLLVLKFSDPELKEKLKATGEEELIEGNNWNDTF